MHLRHGQKVTEAVPVVQALLVEVAQVVCQLVLGALEPQAVPVQVVEPQAVVRPMLRLQLLV